MMLAVERRLQIEQIINEDKSVLVVELAKQFDVEICSGKVINVPPLLTDEGGVKGRGTAAQIQERL